MLHSVNYQLKLFFFEFNISFLDVYVTELRIGTISPNFLSVCPSERNRATPAGWIFVKFLILDLYCIFDTHSNLC